MLVQLDTEEQMTMAFTWTLLVVAPVSRWLNPSHRDVHWTQPHRAQMTALVYTRRQEVTQYYKL